MDETIKGLVLYINNRIANDEEQELFYNFVSNLKSSKKVCSIFRGSNVHNHYETSLDNLQLLAQEIFLVGEKSKYFFESHKPYDNVFQFIWDKFNSKVCKLNFNASGTIEHVSHFLEKNPNIKKYFSEDTNKDIFVRLSKLQNKERNAIADYYLAILQTIGKSGNSRSYFLSTAKREKVAEGFVNNNDGIILYGWVPRRGLKKNIVKYIDLEEKSHILEKYDLPKCESSIYPKQSEICIKCGLLPHFIIGFQYQKKFYINPSTLNKWNDDIISNGLSIDQTGFSEIFNRSKYNSSFIFTDGTYYVISKDDFSNI